MLDLVLVSLHPVTLKFITCSLLLCSQFSSQFIEHVTVEFTGRGTKIKVDYKKKERQINFIVVGPITDPAKRITGIHTQIHDIVLVARTGTNLLCVPSCYVVTLHSMICPPMHNFSEHCS